MTYEEARIILNNLKRKSREANYIKMELDDIKSDYAALTLHSQLGNMQEIHTNTVTSTVERAVMRIEEVRERYDTAKAKVYDIEDSFNKALKQLNPTEQMIIIGFYERGKKIFQIAQDVNYCDRTVLRIKKKAIKKIARRM